MISCRPRNARYAQPFPRPRLSLHTMVRTVVFVALAAGLTGPLQANIVQVPPGFRVSPPRGDDGDGLYVRYKDVPTDAGCSLAFCAEATDTVTVQVITMPNINYLLNTGCTFGPYNFGCDYFETRWDSFINIKVPGDYRFAIQSDDGGSIAFGDTTILALDGGHWFDNATSDTIRFAVPGLYPFRAYYFDCPVCCRGFRFGGMGPAGSGMMPFTPGFDFNADLGPCCSFGSNGPGLSVVPPELFFRTLPTVSVNDGAGVTAGTILRCWASPNPAHSSTVLAVELAKGQRVWAELFDASGRRVSTLANGERQSQGLTRWSWSPTSSQPGRSSNGIYFYRVRTEDGSTTSGSVVIVR